MSNMRMLISSLILGVAFIGCAAEPPAPAPAPTDDPSTPSTPTDDPSTDRTPPAPDDTTTPDDGAPIEETAITPTAATCTTGGLMCCNVVVSANSSLVSNLLALLGIQASLLTDPVGVSCQAVASAAACPRVPACCASSVANLVALGCNRQ